MLNRMTNRIIVAILTFSVIAVLCSCSNDDSLKKGSYYLSTGDGTDKNSYIEVIDKDTLSFNNIDVTELIEGEIQGFAELGGIMEVDGHEFVFDKASADELEEYKNLRKEFFVGERKYTITKSGDVNELYFDKDGISVAEYISDSHTIEISGKSYVLEK